MTNTKIIGSITITLLFSINTVKAQMRSMVVADSADKLALPYATVKVINKNYGCYSDVNGLVTIQADENDSLLITYTGYRNALVTLKKNDDTIFLAKKIYDEPEVTLISLVKETKAGFFKYRSFFTFFFGESSELAMGIDLSGIERSYRINKIYLPLDINRKTFQNSVCKIHLYKQDAHGRPGEELLRKPVLVDKTFGTKNDFYIDISDQDIVCSEKILFIGIECAMDKITDTYKQGLSERKDFNQKARTSPISLFFAKDTAYFNGSYDHQFFRTLTEKSYQWSGGHDALNKKAMNIAAGLVLLTGN
jgi:hypothetical protein